eukprot:229619-Rhodomonas_salina.1
MLTLPALDIGHIQVTSFNVLSGAGALLRTPPALPSGQTPTPLPAHAVSSTNVAYGLMHPLNFNVLSGAGALLRTPPALPSGQTPTPLPAHAVSVPGTGVPCLLAHCCTSGTDL